jgi:NAD(P)-dependent dehydrogenase (short-subunit alcohol dehydrogenase family)
MKLTDKVAIVTGGAGGIGSAIALRFGREGAKVVVTDMHLERAEQVAEEVRKSGAEALAVKADVRNMQEIQHMVSLTLETFGKIDILINNAGGATRVINKSGEFHTCEVETLDWVIDANLKGVLYCSRAIINHMMERGTGRIINMASIAGVVGTQRNGTGYAAAKGGVIAFTKSLAMEIGTHGIRVNAVSPGAILNLPSLANAKTYVGRGGQPEEVASLVLFLSSDEADYITGQNYIIDGGRCWGPRE